MSFQYTHARTHARTHTHTHTQKDGTLNVYLLLPIDYDGRMLSIPGASELQLNTTHGGIDETPSNTSLEPRQPGEMRMSSKHVNLLSLSDVV